MPTLITKSDFLRYLDCPAYFWFFKKRPTIFADQELSDFQKELVKNGREVELWARRLFPQGKLVKSREQAAIRETQKFLKDGEMAIFQATFEIDDLYAMVDVLEWDGVKGYWIINEVKGTSSKDKKDKKHLYGATFQYVLLKKAGYSVEQVNLIELNKEFRKQGPIDPRKLLHTTDITDIAKDLEEEVNLMILDMKRLLESDREPQPCDCIYKSRSNQCPTFKYVPEDFKLSKYQGNHVNVVEIKKQLGELVYPLYFLDYETYPTAIPIYDECGPFQQVPFQYSLHILKEVGGELEHHEFIHIDRDSHPMVALADELMKVLGDAGSIVVWNKKFEGKCHTDIAGLLPEYAEIFHGYNERMYDLMDVFSQHHYLRHEFRGKFSIKAVLPVLVPELSYESLNIQDGSMAVTGWKAMMFEMRYQNEKDLMKGDLLEYCRLDTLAMVKIFEVLEGL